MRNLVIALAFNAVLLAVFFLFVNHTLAGVACGVSLLVWFFVWLKRVQDRKEAEFQARWEGVPLTKVEKHALLRVLESDGYSQTQGQGALVLTETCLDFDLMMLSKRVTIPLDRITEVSKTKRLLGVGMVMDFLLVRFDTPEGGTDALGVHVPDLPAWMAAVDEARRRV